MTMPFLPATFSLDNARPAGRFRQLDVTLATRAPCPECGPHGRIHSRGFLHGAPWVVRDLPHGVPVELHVRRRRYECAVCKGRPGGAAVQTFTERGADTHPRYDMTKRLYDHIVGLLPREPLQAIAERTGVPSATLWCMAIELSQRLDRGHRFPTPTVLAMDGIKLRNIEYMVVAEGVTGQPIGFIKSMQADVIRAWVNERIDVDLVKILVADLHRTNTSVARLKLPNALYVADKWHVVQRYQKMLSQVINQEIDRLRKVGKKEAASTIYNFKPGLMAVNKKLRRTRRTAKGGMRTLDFHNDMMPIFKSYPLIRRAFWARYDFIRFYRAPNLKEALPWLSQFRRHTESFAGLKTYKDFMGHLDANWPLITNYFQTVTQRAGGQWRGVTTNALEQHNGQIRKRVRARNGVQNLDLLRLISVYGSRRIGQDILLCANADCDAAIGPIYGPAASLEMREAAGVYWHCPACR